MPGTGMCSMAGAAGALHPYVDLQVEEARRCIKLCEAAEKTTALGPGLRLHARTPKPTGKPSCGGDRLDTHSQKLAAALVGGLQEMEGLERAGVCAVRRLEALEIVKHVQQVI